MHVMHAPVPAAAEAVAKQTVLRQPLVGWRRCTKDVHDPNGLLDTRSASPRAPVSIAAVGLEGILSEASLASSQKRRTLREIECLLNGNHQKGKMMIMIMKTSGSQVDSPVAEGKRKEGGGRKIRDLHRDT